MCKFTGRHFTCVQAYRWGKFLEVILTPGTLMGNWDLSHWWFLVKWDKGIRIKNTHPIVSTWWHSGPFGRTIVEGGFSLSFLTMASIFSDMAHLFELDNTCFYCYFSFLLIVFVLYHHLLYCSGLLSLILALVLPLKIIQNRESIPLSGPFQQVRNPSLTHFAV